MILQDLNHILNKLAQHPDRETVLELGFALVEWMGLSPNANKKPQLVAPQTQKLKDYLAPAPQTVQPQLYRLSAEGQAIRVRFAVLKKIKKEYISQLVDNDPGLTSYQAFTKNLTATGTAYIPSQPYFIHFVTTPEYDRLILIFNQGDQKRVLTFRNKLTQTQYNKIIQQWAGIAAKPKPEIADLFWQSLDVKEVNKEFYKQIKERFDALVGIAKSTRVNAAENQVKQFAVRLIGRYIFCWFLKEKRIIPEDLLASKTIAAHKTNYYKQYLLHLFFNTLNTEVQNREVALGKDALYDHFIRIPYLNGGLFDKHKEDDLFNDVELNDWLLQFVKVLEEFDFTVDESHSTYQLVAIDPEMLGRIFENLLASQNPETEKMANQRKAFGAFYTPREIVDYMVDSAIKSYLEQKLLPSDPQEMAVEEPLPSYAGTLFQSIAPKQALLPVDAKKQNSAYETKRKSIQNKLEKLFSPSNAENPFDKHETAIVQEALREIKILDPACGSGAFPMGALLRLMELREMVGNSLSNSYELKSEILSRNIFGVDIMPMAVEIARLRAWLSLVLEAEYKPADAKHNFGIKALPNLDFKFVCANTLIDSGYDGFLQHVESNAALRRLDGEIQKLEHLRDQYFDPKGDKQVKAKLRKEFNDTKEYIKTEFKSLGKSWNLEDFLSKVDDWDPFDDGKPSSFFSPAWMFGVKGGFDVLIGNPPYVRQEAIDPYYKPLYIQNHPEVGSGTADLYVYFFDEALNATKPDGIIIFITLNKYLKTKYGQGLRKRLKEKNVDLIIDFFELPVFEASTDTAITKIINVPDTDITRYFPVKSLDNLDLNILTKGEPLKVIKEGTEWQFVEPRANLLIKKMYADTISLQEFTNDKILFGLKTGLNEAFELSDEEANLLLMSESKSLVKPFIKSTDIQKYSLKNAHKYFLVTGYDIDIPGLYPSAFKYLKKFEEKLKVRQDQGKSWYNLRACAYYEEFAKPKLVYIYTAKKQEFYLDTEGRYINNNCYMVISDNKYLFFFLNSILFDWFKRIKFVAYGDADEGGRVKLDYNKMITVPIKQISKEQLKWFEQKYQEIKKSLSDTAKVKHLENIVEVALFKLYQFSYTEVKTVCPDFWLSEEEYKSFKLE